MTPPWPAGTDAPQTAAETLRDWVKTRLAVPTYRARLPAKRHIKYIVPGEKADAGIRVRFLAQKDTALPHYFTNTNGKRVVEDSHQFQIIVSGDDKSGGAEAVSKAASAVRSVLDLAVYDEPTTAALNALGIFNLRFDPEPMESNSDDTDGPFRQVPVSLRFDTEVLV